MESNPGWWRGKRAAMGFVAVGFAIRAFVKLKLGFPDGLLFGLWTILPYVLLVLFSPVIESRVALIAAGFAIVATDISAVGEAARGENSTSVIALGLQPAFAIFAIIPAGILLSVLHGAAKRVLRKKAHDQSSTSGRRPTRDENENR